MTTAAPPQVAFPVDGLQPWERPDHRASAITPDTEFLPGRDCFVADGLVQENGEALTLQSGVPGAGDFTYAIYRFPLGDANPGVVCIDANLLDEHTLNSGYFAGLANYSKERWDWYGPFFDHHVRLSTGRNIRQGATYNSELGNMFICVAVCDGAQIDVVGLGYEPFSAADLTAPPPPTGLAATPVAGGVELRWFATEADDLAGYLICWRSQSFDFPDSTGVRRLGYLIGGTRHILNGLSGEVYIRVAAVDFSGNLSPLSNEVLAGPLVEAPPPVLMLADSPSGLLYSEITLTASGADTYDWDLDGDGVFDDVTGDSGGVQRADTASAGLIRPAVRGFAGGGDLTACGAVSLLIHANSRPSAAAYVTPAFGEAPLMVGFRGVGEDSDGEVVAGGWDFDGDGYNDVWSEGGDLSALVPPDHLYFAPGIYNAKLHVQDDEGAWDMDTVAVLVTDPDQGENIPPVPVLIPDLNGGEPPLHVQFDASDSADPDGFIARYDYDFNSDGVWEIYDGFDQVAWTFTEDGYYIVTLRVTDNGWGQDSTQIMITVATPANELPTASLAVDFRSGSVPHTVRLDASGSSDPDGSIVLYEWDFDGNGSIDEGSTAPVIQHTYFRAGRYEARVRVTDNRGGQDFAFVEIRAHGWASMCLAPVNDGGGGGGGYVGGCWLIETNGRPSVGYWYITGTTHNLRFINANDEHGSSWGEPQELAVVNLLPGYVASGDLDVVNDMPAISYTDEEAVAERLYYRRALDADGDAWAPAVQVLQAVDELAGLDLEQIAGNPAVAYWDWDPAPDAILRFVRATDATGSAWGAPVSVRSGAGVSGNDCDLATIYYLPAVVYSVDPSRFLQYQYGTNAQGSSWSAPIDMGATGTDPSLIETPTLLDSVPMVSYSAASTLVELCSVRSSSAFGTSWYPPETVDDSMGCVYSSLLMDYWQGSAHVFYLRNYDRLCHVESASLFGGVYWYEPEVIDPDASCSMKVGSAMLDGSPAVAYCDYVDGVVKFACLY